MFFLKSSSAALSLLLAIQVHGHAIITPDINGGTQRNDVTRPSANAPCGAGVNIASLINTAQAVPVSNGQIDATITNFNGGTDGSRFVTAQIDPTGTGKSFQDATVTTNGDKSPTDTGSQPLVVQVPAGVTASGGASGNKMLVAFTTLGKFGNCVVATTGGAGAATGNSTAAGGGNTQTGAGTTTTGTGKAAGAGNGNGAGAGAGKAVGGNGNGAAGAGAGKAKGAGAGKAKGAGAAGGEKKKHGHKKAGAGQKKDRHVQKKQREVQKLRLRNAVDAMDVTN